MIEGIKCTNLKFRRPQQKQFDNLFKIFVDPGISVRRRLVNMPKSKSVVFAEQSFRNVTFLNECS